MKTEKLEPLKYSDVDDKCYGVAGMVIGLAIVDCEKYISDVSIDRENIESILFTPDFYVAESPNVSAKAVWNMMNERYQIITALVLSNIICRTSVQHHKRLSADLLDAVRDLLLDEGNDLCSLERDEATQVFDKYAGYLMRVFGSGQLSPIVNDIVGQLRDKHTLSRSEILELLADIS